MADQDEVPEVEGFDSPAFRLANNKHPELVKSQMLPDPMAIGDLVSASSIAIDHNGVK